MASAEKEFEKYLKYLTYKVVQVVVQSRQGSPFRSRSDPKGKDWFNLSIVDDKQVSGELKKTLGGRLPERNNPVCIEIQMETVEQNTVVLEVWSINLDESQRDVTVSITHVLYPRLTLMLKSLLAISRTTPAYRLSRVNGEFHFKFNLYVGPPDLSEQQKKDFKHVVFAKTSCPNGTILLAVDYQPVITLPDRSPESVDKPVAEVACSPADPCRTLQLPFLPTTAQSNIPSPSSVHIFGSHLTSKVPYNTQDSCPSNNEGSTTPDGTTLSRHPSVTLVSHNDGYVVVDFTELKPAFAESGDELGDLLRQCKDVPQLDMFSDESRMDVPAALRLIEEKEDGK